MYIKDRTNRRIDKNQENSQDDMENSMTNHSERSSQALENGYGEWIQVCNRVSNRLSNGQRVVVLCTSEDTARASDCIRQGKGNVVFIKGKWTSGILTNTPILVDYMKTYLQTPDHLKKPSEKRHYEAYRMDLEPWLRAEDHNRIPSRRRCRDAERHQVARKEARRCGVPSVGVYTDAQNFAKITKRCTYHVPRLKGERTHIRTIRGRRGEYCNIKNDV